MTRSIHRLAVHELEVAAKFYANEAGTRVAARFLDEFERVVRLLEQYPGIGSATADGRLAFPLVGFPYTVIYRSLPNEVPVLVVRHQRRDPAQGDGRQ